MTTDAPTRYYAPQVRVIDAGAPRANGQEVLVGATAVLDATGADTGNVHLDVVSASVTLVNSGIGQLTLVMNNQRFTADGKPTSPPWKYNGLNLVKFGQLLRVDMTYGEQPWTKMILAQVNNVKFSFPAGGAAQVTVTGEDLGCMLNRFDDEDQVYAAGLDEAQVVTQVAARAGAPAFAGAAVDPGERDDAGWITNRGSRIEWPSFTETLPRLTQQAQQTYVQFLQSLTERLDFEVFVDFAKNYLPADETGAARPAPAPGTSPTDPDPNPNEVLLHFEPARSLLGGGEPGFVVDLMWGLNLVDFTPTVKLWDLYTRVRITGREPTAVERVLETIDTDAEIDAVIGEDLGRIAGGPFLEPITATRRRLLADIERPSEMPLRLEFANLDRQRAIHKAKAVIRTKAREACAVEATTIGFPSLRPGCHVDITGLYAPFDGLYYVTKTVHTLDAGGYRTQLSLRRPGLQPPEEYPQ